MKIVIASDKFKGSLSAKQVCLAIQKGIHHFDSEAEIILNPLADGGDGSLEVLAHFFELELVNITVFDPLFRPINTSYKISENRAYIELSAASGLVLLEDSERNCMKTTSFGTGQLIADALQRGLTDIYLFIGGSATNDGGIGIAQALGYCFYDEQGEKLLPVGRNLRHIARIDNSDVIIDFDKIKITVICDVDNPFFGKNGAAFVYAAQKGANQKEIQLLDKGLQNLSGILKKQNYPPIDKISGAGAAGGVGGGAVAFMSAKIASGIKTFLDFTQLEQKLEGVDLIITGEGKLDAQTAQGKVISGVVTLAKKHQIPVIAICGASEIEDAPSIGIQEVYTVLSQSKSVNEAMEKAEEKLEEIAFDIFRQQKLSNAN